MKAWYVTMLVLVGLAVPVRILCLAFLDYPRSGVSRASDAISAIVGVAFFLWGLAMWIGGAQ